VYALCACPAKVRKSNAGCCARARKRKIHVGRLQQMLEEVNIKPDSVISGDVGASGQAMIEVLIVGETGPLWLARLASSRISALRGRANAP